MRVIEAFSNRRGSGAPVTSGTGLESAEQHSVPPALDAVWEALVSGGSPIPACSVGGRELAHDGASLGEALSGLRATYAAAGAAAPELEAAEALAIAWSEATAEFLADVSCEDPLTGLASTPHVRSRVEEVYREAERRGVSARLTHALVVVDLGDTRPAAGLSGAFDGALRLAAVSDALREVFSGDETIARTGRNRLAVLVRRDLPLGEALAGVSAVLEERQVPPPTSMWVEGLPDRVSLGLALLAELSH